MGAGLGAVPRAQADIVDWIRAVVGDSIITRWQVQEPTLNPEFRDSLVRNNPNQSDSFYLAKIAAFEQENLKSMENFQLVLQDFKRLERDNHAKIPDIWVDERIRGIISDPRKYGGDRALFIKSLQAQGLTMEQFRSQVRDSIIVEAMEGQFLHEPLISPHKMEEYYQQHQDQFKLEERVRLQRLFLKKADNDTTGETRKRAEEIRSLYQPGTSFPDLVKSYSDGPAYSDDWRDVSALGQSFRDAISKLKPGECSAVVETADGCFLLELMERDPAHVAPLSEVRDQVEKELTIEETGRQREKWMKHLGAKTFLQDFPDPGF